MKQKGKGGALMQDQKIVQLYWDRDEAAINQTQQKYESYLSKISYNILANFEDSKECVNDTYLAAWNSMPPHRPAVLSTYLGKITRQIAIDVFRKKNSVKRYSSEYALSLSELGDIFPSEETPEDICEKNQLDDAINQFLCSLPENARNAFIGRYYFFDPLKKVAAYCGMSEAKAKSLLYRTRQKLKDYLIKEGLIYEP